MLGLLLLALAGGPGIVRVGSPAHPTLATAVAAARAGDTVVVPAGTYREPTLILDRPVTLLGEPGAVLDGEGRRGLLVVRGPEVTVRGLTFRNTGTSYQEDRAAVLLDGAARCTLDANRFEQTFFAIYLSRTVACTVTDNRIVGTPTAEAATGNAIHSWGSRDLVVRGNRMSGHRDGLYFEFTTHATVVDNLSTGNLRYGLHFMYADSSAYVGNRFLANGSGVAVMYSHHVTMRGNHFSRNRGPTAHGLLLKDITDVTLAGNTFDGNSTGVLADGANRLVATDNSFQANGWAIRLLASSADSRFSGNRFRGNSFDVTVNGRQAAARFDGNWWDAYRGWDLDRDGTGDVPHHPVRLFALLVERAPAAMLLQRSLFVRLVDAAERTVPLLTPDAIVDRHPQMTASAGRAP